MPSTVSSEYVRNIPATGPQEFWYGGGNFGLSQNPDTPVFVSIGTPDGTFDCDAESILRLIERFEPKEQLRVMAQAALHYNMDVWALIDGYANYRKAWDNAACANIREIFDTEAAPQPTAYPLAIRTLFYAGGSVGLGYHISTRHCTFEIVNSGRREEWTVFQTLARFSEFSPAAQKRILSDCRAQIKFPGSLEDE